MKLILALLVALLQDDPIAAEAMKGWKHSWADFGDGSQVTTRETMRQPDISPAGKLVYKDVTTEITTTVMALAGEKTTLKIEGVGQESYIPYFTSLPNWTRGRGEKRGKETIEVGGVKRECDVTMISLDTNKDAGQVTLIYKSPDVPYWAVRWRTETLDKGNPNTSEEELVLEVGSKVKVGDREIPCVVVLSTVEVVGGAKTVKKEWRSDEIPGRVAKRETRQYLNGKEVESAFSQMEVVKVKGRR
ncbi:MAG TPA: hypothetical protein VKW04_15340 [Planctomycetota bacterium]|nr:hypothetical protein [Planctomycetota bacterium]